MDDEPRRPHTPAWYEPALERLHHRLAALAARAGRRLRRIPFTVRIGVAALVLVIVLASASILSLVVRGNSKVAEVDGSIPARLPANRDASFDVAVDNTGDAVLDHVCVVADFDRPATLVSATFGGVDTVPASGNSVCGGLLSSSETVSVVLTIRAAPGPLLVQLRPADGSRVVGQALIGTIDMR